MAYPKNLVASMLRGDAKPLNGRVLLRAVTAQDIHGERTGLVLEESSLRQVAYHEVISVAEGVTSVKPGDLALHVSAAADIANHLDEQCPYLMVPEKHIMYSVARESALAAEAEVEASGQKARDEARLRANGLIV
jgi:co-chaperonin GroES (HSP10)